jgi:hypothetical protein
VPVFLVFPPLPILVILDHVRVIAIDARQLLLVEVVASIAAAGILLFASRRRRA